MTLVATATRALATILNTARNFRILAVGISSRCTTLVRTMARCSNPKWAVVVGRVADCIVACRAIALCILLATSTEVMCVVERSVAIQTTIFVCIDHHRQLCPIVGVGAWIITRCWVGGWIRSWIRSWVRSRIRSWVRCWIRSWIRSWIWCWIWCCSTSITTATAACYDSNLGNACTRSRANKEFLYTLGCQGVLLSSSVATERLELTSNRCCTFVRTKEDIIRIAFGKINRNALNIALKGRCTNVSHLALVDLHTIRVVVDADGPSAIGIGIALWVAIRLHQDTLTLCIGQCCSNLRRLWRWVRIWVGIWCRGWCYDTAIIVGCYGWPSKRLASTKEGQD